MTPHEYINLTNRLQQMFFSKYSKHCYKERNFWRQSRQQAQDTLQTTDWLPETFERHAQRIEGLLHL